jgi:Asp-tRNA(Asn)/Glu-tRNA(Gln) amidotransferase A subunit family amidase
MATTVEDCEALLGVLVPDYRPRPLEALDELAVGLAWSELADAGVARAFAAAVECFPRRRDVDLPFPDAATYAPFMREVADVHRELFAENADLYGEDVRIKLERCLAVGDGDVEHGARLREEYRERVLESLRELDLVLTPTLPVVAPRAGAGGTGDLAVRESLIRFTYPFSALGWPALALPCGTAEDGLPASLQIVGRAGDDAVVLAAGRHVAAVTRALSAAGEQ